MTGPTAEQARAARLAAERSLACGPHEMRWAGVECRCDRCVVSRALLAALPVEPAAPEHVLIGRHRCSCGWEGDHQRVHLADVLRPVEPAADARLAAEGDDLRLRLEAMTDNRDRGDALNRALLARVAAVEVLCDEADASHIHGVPARLIRAALSSGTPTTEETRADG